MIITEIIDYSNPTRVVQNGDIFHFDDEGKLHREDGPAIEYKDGKKEYYKHGKQYTPDNTPDASRKPVVKRTPFNDPDGVYTHNVTITYPDGSVVRGREGKNGTMVYYDDAGEVHRDRDLPAIVGELGVKYWYKHGVHHRDGDLPATVHPAHGYEEWYKNGKRHRDGGKPAVVYDSGEKQWWVNGKLIRKSRGRR